MMVETGFTWRGFECLETHSQCAIYVAKSTAATFVLQLTHGLKQQVINLFIPRELRGNHTVIRLPSTAREPPRSQRITRESFLVWLPLPHTPRSHQHPHEAKYWSPAPSAPPLLPHLIPPCASSRLVALSLPPRAAVPLLPDSTRSQSGEGPDDSALAQRLLSRLTHFHHHPTSAVRATPGYSPRYSTLRREPLR
ncbi:hypothetical protein K438DRAFT_1992498 [Mycena galopus ATCC 62051]|nr:hypothetical protein K438DRAFT_1992498 [Mycena galopus ATCC 62051]